MTNNQTLLPLNASNLLKDLENSSLSATSLEALNKYVTNPDLAPESILPWLAFAVSVDDWSDGWAQDVKRNVIRASVKVHKKKGTIGALRSALEAFNYENIAVEEWFEYDDEPYFFRVFFDITKPGFDVGILPDVRNLVLNTKNARSHLRYLQAFLSNEMGMMGVGAETLYKDVTTLGQFIYEDELVENISSMPLIASAIVGKEISTIYPVSYSKGDELIHETAAMPFIGSSFGSLEIITINPIFGAKGDELINENAAMPFVGSFFKSLETVQINPAFYENGDVLLNETAAMPKVGAYFKSQEIVTINPIFSENGDSLSNESSGITTFGAYFKSQEIITIY
jgi:phage tail P2-like protein